MNLAKVEDVVLNADSNQLKKLKVKLDDIIKLHSENNEDFKSEELYIINSIITMLNNRTYELTHESKQTKIKPNNKHVPLESLDNDDEIILNFNSANTEHFEHNEKYAKSTNTYNNLFDTIGAYKKSYENGRITNNLENLEDDRFDIHIAPLSPPNHLDFKYSKLLENNYLRKTVGSEKDLVFSVNTTRGRKFNTFNALNNLNNAESEKEKLIALKLNALQNSSSKSKFGKLKRNGNKLVCDKNTSRRPNNSNPPDTPLSPSRSKNHIDELINNIIDNNINQRDINDNEINKYRHEFDYSHKDNKETIINSSSVKNFYKKYIPTKNPSLYHYTTSQIDMSNKYMSYKNIDDSPFIKNLQGDIIKIHIKSDKEREQEQKEMKYISGCSKTKDKVKTIKDPQVFPTNKLKLSSNTPNLY